MPNLRGLVAEDKGVRWDIDFEYQQADGNWALFQCQIPRDLDAISVDEHVALLELGIAIARGQGIPEFNE